ncbi:MAG: slt 1 [Firmicutes bacterium]|nr:slt 1 [Bacillota bacterium]
MRSGMIKIWYGLVVLIIVESVAYALAAGLCTYCQRMLRWQFAAVVNSGRLAENIPYADSINRYAMLEEIDSYVVAAVIQTESSFNPCALSRAGAAGLMQIMPDTWENVNAKIKACVGRHPNACGFSCFYDPDLNIHIGTAYLSQLVKQYNGNVSLALAAYNQGPGAIDAKKDIPEDGAEYVDTVIFYWYNLTAEPLSPYGVWFERLKHWKMALCWIEAITLLLFTVVTRKMVTSCRGWRWR